MSRKNTKHYAGPTGSVTLEQLAELGPGWAVQAKMDGQYVEVETDGDGFVDNVYARSGRRVPSHLHGLDGVRTAPPLSRICGELEAHTEAGIRAAQGRPGGLPQLHLFDAIHLAGRPLARLPYRERRHLLYTEVARLEDGHKPQTRDASGRCHDSVGRFNAPVGFRLSMVEQRPARTFEDISVTGGVEGLVAVALDAPLGRRRAKLKWKPVTTIDVVIRRVGARGTVCTVHPIGEPERCWAVSCKGREMLVGDVWELAHEGWHGGGSPRFPRLTKRRDDLYSLEPLVRSAPEPSTGNAQVLQFAPV